MPQTGKIATAKSSSADSGAIVIGEIAGGSGSTTFNGENLALLYDALLGTNYTNTGTLKKVEKHLNKSGRIITGGSSIIKALNTADFRSGTGGKNIYVTFGNIEFEATCLTFDSSGNVILTLWQSTSGTTSSFSAGSGYSADSACANGVVSNVPSNFYSASYIRNVTLGAGNTYNVYGAANATAPSSTGTGSLTPADSRWAQFTTGNYASYIVEPAQVHYQQVENYCAIDSSWFTLPEEAYGTPAGEKYFKKYRHPNGASSATPQTGYYYFDSGYGGGGSNPKSRNGEWQNDKIWLPSYTEVFSGGIWKLDANQRSNGGSSTNSSLASTMTDAAWSYLRNGHADTAKFAYCLNATGGYGAAESGAKAAVRPALHLNLTKASQHTNTAEGAKNTAVNTPTDIEFTYDGIEYTDMASIIARVEAGKQKSPADAKGDTNVNKEIKWFDEVLHAGGGNTTTAGTAADTIYTTDSAIEYKIEYKQIGKSSYEIPMTEFKIKGAGEYKITCSFETNSGKPYKWRDIKTGATDTAASKTFTIKINQLEVKYKWKSSSGKLNETNADPAKRWKVTFDKDTFTPNLTLTTTATSAAPWVYLDYTLLKDNGIKDNANAALLTYDQTSKKSILGKESDGVTDKYDDTLPCVVVKYTNTEGYDNLLDNIYVNKNGTTTPVNGTSRAFPQEAGNYTVNATDINAATSNYKLVPDTGEVGLTTSTSSPTRGYEIEKQEVNVPVKPSTILEYSGSEQSYCVSNYDEDYMEYGTWNSATSVFTKDGMPKDSAGADLGMTAGTTGSDAPLTLKATKVNDYKVSYQLIKTTVENTTAHPDPLVRNYKWKSADTTINGTTEVVTINYAIEPKTLELDFHSSVTNSSGSETFTIKTNNTDGKLTYSFKANCDPVIPDGETMPEEPVLELYFKVADSTGTGTKNPDNATTPDEFLYKNLLDSTGKHTAGKYIIYVALASSTANPINKNYRLKDVDAITAAMTEDGASTSDIDAAVKAAKATYEKEINLTAGEVSLNDLPIVYKEGDTITNSDLPTELSFDYTNEKNLQFKLGTDGKTPVVYWIYFNLDDDFSFLETVGAISYQYAAPATDTTVCTYDPYAAMTGSTTGSYPMRYAGTLTITVKVQVKASDRTNNKLPAQTDYDNLATATSPNKFTYTAGTPDSTTGNVYDGTLVFTYEIRKAEVDETKLDDTKLLQWKYSTEDDTKWKDYTDTSYPEYNDIALVDFRVNPSKYNSNGDGYLSGVTAASLDSITNAAGAPEKQGPGKRFVTIAYTVDENNYEKVNHDNTTLVGKYEYEVEISPKIIDSSDLTLTTWKDTNGNDLTNSLGVPYQIWELNLPDPAFANFIDYEYYLYDPATRSVGALIGTGDTALSDLTNPSGPYAYLNIDAGSSAYIYVKPVINLAKVDKVNGEPKYALKDLSGNTDKDTNGNDGYKKYEFGKQMTVISVELLKNDSVYGTAFTAADIIKITMGGSVAAESTYNTKVYKDKIDEDNLVGDLAAFCTNSATLDAGKYIIKVTAVNEDLFVAVPATVNFEVLPKEVELPTLDVIVFNGSGQSLADFLGGSWDPALMTLGGDYEDIRDVSSSSYSATITLKNSNYCWAYPTATPSPTVKVLTKYSAADYEITPVNATVAEYKWNVTPLVVDTTNMWNKSGNKGATLNLPQNIKDLIAGGTLEVGYRYYDGDGNFVETPEIKGGKSFKVEAVFGGDDSVRNVQFKTGDTTLGNTSPAINYTVPQSGAAALFGNALSFLKNNWWWLLIALAVLLFLIILIIIIAKRRKHKEEREEKKRLKEEEKRRKEEEREERKRKQEAELELQKAKQEAELAKLKAGLGMGAGAAGMAMAAQQQPQQQTMPQQPMQQQPQYQPQYQQMPDNSVLARIEAELADIRAQQRMSNNYPQMPMMQMPMMPIQGYGPQMGGGMGGGHSSDTSMMALMQAQLAQMQADHKTELAEMRAGQSAAMKTEFEILKLKLDGKDGGTTHNSSTEITRTEKNDNEALGAVLASMVRNLAGEIPAKPAKAELPQSVEESKPVSVAYPADAVVTTTTTVDTTKSKPEPAAPRSDDGRVFDLDGFYDTFDNNK